MPIPRSQVSFLLLLLGVVSAASGPAWGNTGEEIPGKRDDTSPKWYLSVGATNCYPRLQGVEKQVHHQINDMFHLMAPGFEDAKTFTEMRDDGMLWVPEIGLGRVLTPRWVVFARVGYIEGAARTKADNTSLILRPLHTDVKLHVSYFFAGAGAAFYPWGVPELRAYESVWDRVRNVRPFIAGSVGRARVKAYADVHFGLKPYDSVFRAGRRVGWSPWEGELSGGLQVPLTKATSLSLDLSYRTFSSGREDLNGLAAGIRWQWHF